VRLWARRDDHGLDIRLRDQLEPIAVNAVEPHLARERCRTLQFDIGDRDELGADHVARKQSDVQASHGAGADDPDPHAAKDAGSPSGTTRR
jgi:hypothetical protein